MTEFGHELHDRIATALESLHEARGEGEEYLVEVRLGELEELGRLAGEHGIAVPGLHEELATLELSEDTRTGALEMNTVNLDAGAEAASR